LKFLGGKGKEKAEKYISFVKDIFGNVDKIVYICIEIEIDFYLNVN